MAYGYRGIERDGIRGGRGWERVKDEGIGDAAIDVASLPLDVGGEQILTVTLSLHAVLKQVTQNLRRRVKLY